MKTKATLIHFGRLVVLTSFLIMVLGSQYANAQLLSYFSWDSNPVTQADFGPNGTIKSGSPAISSPATFNGTNGLNPNEGANHGPTVGIDLDLDVSNGSFDVNGIDISIAFQREEGDGYFVTRGNDFNFGMSGGRLFVEFSIRDMSGSIRKIQSGSIYDIPFDDNFRMYRFVYNQNTGIAEVWVDETIVWTHIASVGDELYWSHPTIRIGDLMDGNGESVAIFDELTIQGIPNDPGYPNALPVEWLDFSCKETINGIDLNWSTATETNNQYFEVERSVDGQKFVTVSSEIAGAGNSSFENHYAYLDNRPAAAMNYYRIKQVDYDGQYEYSDILSCAYSRAEESIKLYPNPAVDVVSVTSSIDESVFLIDSSGKVLYQATIEANNQFDIQVSDFPRGVYFVKTSQNTKKLVLR